MFLILLQLCELMNFCTDLKSFVLIIRNFCFESESSGYYFNANVPFVQMFLYVKNPAKKPKWSIKTFFMDFVALFAKIWFWLEAKSILAAF